MIREMLFQSVPRRLFFCFFVGKLEWKSFFQSRHFRLLFSSWQKTSSSAKGTRNVPFFSSSSRKLQVIPLSISYLWEDIRYARRVIARRTMVRWTRNEIKKEEKKRRRKGKTLFKALYSLSLLLQRKWTIKLFEATMTMGWDGMRRGEGKEREREYRSRFFDDTKINSIPLNNKISLSMGKGSRDDGNYRWLINCVRSYRYGCKGKKFVH